MTRLPGRPFMFPSRIASYRHSRRHTTAPLRQTIGVCDAYAAANDPGSPRGARILPLPKCR